MRAACLFGEKRAGSVFFVGVKRPCAGAIKDAAGSSQEVDVSRWALSLVG